MLTDEQLQELLELEAKATKGPWCIWEGVPYEGGGEDLCVGAGDTWLANMDHRRTRCPQILDDGHNADECDICTIDADRITEEERANGQVIVAARNHLRELVEEVRRLRTLREKVRAYQDARDALLHRERDLDTGDLIDDSDVDPQVRANIAEADMFDALADTEGEE